MRTSLYWEAFADAVISRLIRPEPADPLLVVTSTAHDISLAEACLAAGIRAGADTQLIVKARRVKGTASQLGPILADAIRASKLILDLCDEIGLMVYEESYAAWCLANSPAMPRRYNESTLGMIRRDRNHPSVVIWGLLNETPDGPVMEVRCAP